MRNNERYTTVCPDPADVIGCPPSAIVDVLGRSLAQGLLFTCYSPLFSLYVYSHIHFINDNDTGTAIYMPAIFHP